MRDETLMQMAIAARESAYSPYSGYTVGAALLTADGRVYTGCNIENAAFSPTCCAERLAFFKAVQEGERRFSAIAVAGGEGQSTQNFCTPCGVCRQVMGEFCGADFRVLLTDGSGAIRVFRLDELLPFGFSFDQSSEDKGTKE